MPDFIFLAITAAEKSSLFLDLMKFSRQRKILTKSVEREISVKGTGSRCVLEESVKDN